MINMGYPGIELGTSPLSGVRSNQNKLIAPEY